MQSSSSHILTPSTPSSALIQTSNPAPKTQIPIVDLEESDEEQGLQSDVLNLLVKSATTSEQHTVSVPTPDVTSQI